MLPLLVEITNTETGARVEAGFKRSPVRIGRNALNDLAIDESFVSQWHGLVRFDDAGTRFLDLGSTNGTFLGDDRLESNVEVEVTDETRLRIGPLRVRLARLALSDDKFLPRRASPFSLGGTTRAAKGVGAGGTLELGKSGARSLDQIAATLSDAGRPIAMDQLKAMADRQRELIAKLRPLYQEYERAWAALEGPMKEALASAANETEREIRINLLEGQFELAFEHASLSGKSPSAGSGADVAQWLSVLAPSVAAKWDDPEAALNRAGAVLEAFASAVMNLREGQKQVRAELGVEAGSESEALPSFDDSRALLGYLLDPEADAAFRLDELARTFAGFAVHQLGIVNGALDGARALLAALSPQGVGAAASGAIAPTSMGFGDWLWPFRAAANYYRYVGKHLELSTGSTFTKHLFGASFARAYYRVTGARRG